MGAKYKYIINSKNSHHIAFFFFFFWSAFLWLWWLFQWILCTIHETNKHLFSIKLSLKMGLTVLFTYLKIILLQCFSFFSFQKISGIQIHYLYELYTSYKFGTILNWSIVFQNLQFSLSNTITISMYPFRYSMSYLPFQPHKKNVICR